MKLRNKKTKEIGNLKPCFDDEKIAVWVENKSSRECRYNSLAELSAEWEDYKEPFSTSFYTVEDGAIKHCIFYSKRVAGCPDDARAYFGDYGRESVKQLKEVGLYFETKAEVELVVRKLKAWKRLKDKGFRFINWEFRDVLDGTLVVEARLNFNNDSDIQRDLEICFGGEE